jgi:hypothetical protein
VTITEILDGLAELGRLRLEREARERAEAERRAIHAQNADDPPDDAPVQPEPRERRQ